jgi:hypothetical protein
LGVVTHLWGITLQTVGYLSKELDQVAKGWPRCLRAVAAVSFLCLKLKNLFQTVP